MKEKLDGLVEHFLSGNILLEEAIEVLERSMIQRALERRRGNRSAASKLLGIHRNTLQRKMAQYGLGNRRVRPRGKPMAREGRLRKRKTGAA
ncbi:MAG: helix-turn-helix domain-containing protein [Bryobacteraceae bacterium]|jgi:two-component system C4-dicarboxylate transport response regulator DctD